jgi:hypothetical protein
MGMDVRDAIGDGAAMRVAREVRENGFGSAEWLLRVDPPFRSPDDLRLYQPVLLIRDLRTKARIMA